MKLGTLVGDPCRIVFRLGSNSDALWWPPSLILIWPSYLTYFVYNFETKADKNVISVPTPTFSGSRNPVKSLV